MFKIKIESYPHNNFDKADANKINVGISRNGDSWQTFLLSADELIKLNEEITKYLNSLTSKK